MNSIDAAWVAGIIEGEGCMGLDNMGPKSGNRSPKAYIRVAMTDEDVIRALHAKTGVGNVYGPHKGGGSKGADHWKDQWEWAVTKREDVQNIIQTVLPFLYERRTIQALICLDAMDKLDAAAAYRKNFCPKGHSKPECLGADGKHCNLCRRVEKTEVV